MTSSLHSGENTTMKGCAFSSFIKSKLRTISNKYKLFEMKPKHELGVGLIPDDGPRCRKLCSLGEVSCTAQFF